MGKASKARKRQKIERDITDPNSAYHLCTLSEDEDNDSDGEVVQQGKCSRESVLLAITVFECLSRRLDMYEGKSLKLLRVASYPLVQSQKTKFFELPAEQQPLTDTEFHNIVNTKAISTAVLVSNYFANDIEEFTNEEYKHLRKSLYPLVMYAKVKAAYAQTAAGKTLGASVLGINIKSIHELIAGSSSDSLTNRISHCFRSRDYNGALLALGQMEKSCNFSNKNEAERNAAMPKLGSLQRWVRDCDVSALSIPGTLEQGKAEEVSIAGSAQHNSVATASVELQELSSLLLHAVLRVTHLLTMQSQLSAANTNTHINNINHTTTAASSKLSAGSSSGSSGSSGSASAIETGTIAKTNGNNMQVRPKQLGKHNSVNSTTVSRYPYKKAVKMNFPAFAVPRAYGTEAYLQQGVLGALVQEAAAAGEAARLQSSLKSIMPADEPSNSTLAVNSCTCIIPPVDVFRSKVRVVSHVPGPQRRPPTAHDLNIYATAPGTVRFFDTADSLLCPPCALHPPAHTPSLLCSSAPSSTAAVASPVVLASAPLPAPVQARPARHDVPSVPGAMLLTGVLTPLECAQFMLAAERLCYTPDSVDGIDNVVWLADDSLLSPIYARVRDLLPPHLEGHALAGINARLRLFRYYPGAEYRPHIDGAWPGSGLLPDGTYTDDAFSADRHSRLTFLVYLNEGFEGGHTTYFLPGPETDGADNTKGEVTGEAAGDDQSTGYIEIRKVKPQLGAVLVFPHGSANGSLVHEGSAVLQGVKYVIRTDVLYTTKCVV